MTYEQLKYLIMAWRKLNTVSSHTEIIGDDKLYFYDFPNELCLLGISVKYLLTIAKVEFTIISSLDDLSSTVMIKTNNKLLKKLLDDKSESEDVYYR